MQPQSPIINIPDRRAQCPQQLRKIQQYYRKGNRFMKSNNIFLMILKQIGQELVGKQLEEISIQY